MTMIARLFIIAARGYQRRGKGTLRSCRVNEPMNGSFRARVNTTIDVREVFVYGRH